MFGVRRLLGFKYLLNLASGEVHRLKNVTRACGIDKMAKRNKKFLTESQYKGIIEVADSVAKNSNKENTINGCVHCFKETDTD